MGKKSELKKEYLKWLELEIQANRQHASKDRRICETQLKKLEGYLSSPIKARFIPRYVDPNRGGILYREKINKARRNINWSFNSLKARIEKNISYNLKKGSISATEAAALRKEIFDKLEKAKTQYLKPFNQLETRAQNLNRKYYEKYGGSVYEKQVKILKNKKQKTSAARTTRTVKPRATKKISTGKKIKSVPTRKIVRGKVSTKIPQYIQYYNKTRRTWIKVHVPTRKKIGERATKYLNIPIIRR